MKTAFSIVFPETRLTRKVAVGVSLRERSGRFNVSFAIAAFAPDAGAFSLLWTARRMPPDGLRFVYLNYAA